MTDPNVNPSPSSQPEYLSNEGAGSSATPAPEKKSATGKVVGGVAALATVAVIACGGAFAYSMLNGSGDYPYDHLADGAFAYAQTNMDPSAGQKLAINDLAKKFPELKNEEGYDVFTAENINAAFLEESLGTDTKYPWVGDRMAFAAYPDNGDEDSDPQIAVLIETTDPAASKKDLPGMLEELNGEPVVYDGELETDPSEMPELNEPVEPGMPETETPGTDPNMPEMINPDLDGDGEISPNEEALAEQSTNQISYTTQDEVTAEDPGTTAMPNTDPSNDKAVFTGNVYEDKWVAISDGALVDYFESDSSLADNDSFVNRMEDVQGNVVSAYVDLDGFSAAVESTEEEFPGLTGEGVATVEVRDDGIDVSSEMFGVKVDGKVFGPQGDAEALTKLLEDNSYEDAAFNLAIAGLGDSVANALSSYEEGGTTLDEDVTSEDVRVLLGDKASLSVKGKTLEELEGKLILTGVDEAKWNEYLATEGVTPEQLAEEASSELGRDMQFTIENGELMVLVGAAPEGGQSFEDGVVTGSVNLDDVASIIHNLTFFGEQPEGEAPKDLGTVEFYSDSDDEGNGKAMASWNTPR